MQQYLNQLRQYVHYNLLLYILRFYDIDIAYCFAVHCRIHKLVSYYEENRGSYAIDFQLQF